MTRAPDRVARHAERGATLVEFAFASTLIMTLMFGVIDFGRALFDYHLVTEAARIGLRYAIVNSALTSANVQTYVRSQVDGIDPATLTVSMTAPTAANCLTAVVQAGCNVVVVATYPFAFAAFPALPSITMSSTAQMPLSQ